ncbi:hypothetical protein BU15DRAFT_64365 [Melanogaster broomeanus]|nr:hypothetical protein BU15DRAFT_64365 [Melanogaster broomeanus]
MTTKGKKKAMRGKVISTLQHIRKGDVQSMVEKIHKELHEATISYTLMIIHDKIDLNNCLSIITQIINSRSLNIKYVKEFTRWVKSKGLHNKMVENAIMQKAYLQAIVKRNHTVVITKATIDASDDSALLEHHLTTNIPISNLKDSNDDKVV